MDAAQPARGVTVLTPAGKTKKPAKFAGFLSSTATGYFFDCRKPSIRYSATLNQAFCVFRYLSNSV